MCGGYGPHRRAQGMVTGLGKGGVQSGAHGDFVSGCSFGISRASLQEGPRGREGRPGMGTEPGPDVWVAGCWQGHLRAAPARCGAWRDESIGWRRGSGQHGRGCSSFPRDQGPRGHGIARPQEVTSRLRAAGFRANQVCLFT